MISKIKTVYVPIKGHLVWYAMSAEKKKTQGKVHRKYAKGESCLTGERRTT